MTKSLLDQIFNFSTVEVLTYNTHPSNIASQRVAHKVGFKQCSHLGNGFNFNFYCNPKNIEHKNQLMKNLEKITQ